MIRGDSLSQYLTKNSCALVYLPGQAVRLRVVVAEVADLAPDNFSFKATHEEKGTTKTEMDESLKRRCLCGKSCDH